MFGGYRTMKDVLKSYRDRPGFQPFLDFFHLS
ncbi:hypothetical protein ES703_21296 [subsurface metagenome]